MNILTLVLQAAPQQAPAGGGMSIWIMLALMFVVMWFFMIRPQRKQQKELEKVDGDVKLRVDKQCLVRDYTEGQQQ